MSYESSLKMNSTNYLSSNTNYYLSSLSSRLSYPPVIPLLCAAILILVLLLIRLILYDYITQNCCPRPKVQEIHELQERNPHLMEALPLTAIYKNYVFRKLQYLRFTKLKQKYPFVNDYYIDGFKFDREHIVRRLKEYTKEQYSTIDKDFDAKIKVYMQKFNQVEKPVIKSNFSYNLGTYKEFESYSYVDLVNTENKDAEMEEKLQKERNERIEKEILDHEGDI